MTVAQRKSTYWWSLLPFGMILVGAIAYAVLAMWRSIDDKKTVILIAIGFSLFASVAVQEYIERTVDWSANWYLSIIHSTVRPLVEEGTELLGMVVLLKVTMNNTQGVFSPGERSDFPVFDAIGRLRWVILVIGMIGAPAIAYFTASLPPERHDNGMPADWPAVALFLLAAISAARPYFAYGRGLEWSGLSLVLLCVAGCVSTTLRPDSVAALPLVGALAGCALLIWIMSPSYLPKTYLPAAIALSIAFAAAWSVGSNDFVVYTIIQYTALAFYWVHSSVVTAGTRSTDLEAKSQKTVPITD
jgi:hypothetical protein